jgi:hypothetical protein
MKLDAISIFIGPSISILILGKPICSALFLKLIFKNNTFLYLYYRMLRHYYGNESYLKFSYGNFSYRGESPNAIPKQRLMTMRQQLSCLNVTAIICPNNLRLIMICRLGTRVRSSFQIDPDYSRHARDVIC